jgi:hypothetical protein
MHTHSSIVTHFSKYIAGIALLGYALLGVVGYVHLLDMATMHESAHACPFADASHTVCEATMADHTRMWQKYLSLTLISLSSFVVLGVLLFVYQKQGASHAQIVLFHYARKRKRAPISPLYVQLFSAGILHPKAP